MHWFLRPRFALAFLLALAACTDPRFSTVAAPSRQEALVPDATRPVMGWNSFDVLSTNRAGYGQTWLNEGHIKDASDAMRQKVQFAGYTYINIDSGWSADLSWTSNTIDQWGVPQADAQRFPSGIKGIADYVHAQGQKLGIYSVVGLPGEIYNGNYPIAGTSCHVQDIVKQPMTLVPNGWYAQWEIDWSNPCAQAYYDSMANEFASWGVDLIKVDGTTADNAGDIIAWQNAVAKTSRPMWFTVSAWPVPLALGPQIRNAGQGVRIDTDIDCYCSTISSWTASVNQRWNDLPNWLPFVGPGHFPDLDSMPISNNTGQAVQDGLNDVERQSVMTFWAMASSPLWVGGDIYFMDAQAQAILTNPEVIAVDQAGVMPVQVAAGNSQVWKKALPDGSIAVAVYNLGDSSTSITVGFGDVGVDGDASVRDLPSRTELGVFTGTWTASNVPAHGSRLVKLTPEASNGIAGYTWCSSEYQDCAAGNNVDVAYGALGHFVVKSGLSGNVSCMLATFGQDPAYGSTKGCYVRPHGGGGPPSYTYCAGEGQTCAPSGIVDVGYGAVGSFTYKLAQQGSFGCNVGTFGGDPAYGWNKACYTRPASGGVAYEAEGAQLQGAAVVAGCSGCAGGKKVGYLGGGAGNRLTFPQVDVATTGNHLVTIHAASADPRTFYVSVNGGAAVPVSLQSGDWSTPTTATLLLGLRAGSNTITFANDGQWAPDLDNIVVDAAASAATPADNLYFVAPDGQGSTCSAQAPCALLTAQAKLRQATSTMLADITVTLADGTYRLGSPLTFDSAAGDSATGGHTVTYAAASGAHPVISGGTRVAGWAQGANGVWAATVPAGTDTRQLYVDGVRANRASGPSPTGLTRTATGYTTSDASLAGWGNVSNIELVYNVAWTQMRCGVASVSGTTVTMQQPCFDNSTKKQYGVNADLPSYLENAKELLNNPGEFYLDKPAHTLYYLPRAGQQMSTADVEIPRLQTVIAGHGTASSPLRGLVIRGITVAYAGWTDPNAADGFSEVQANLRLTGANAWQMQGSCDRFSSTNPGTCPYGNWTMTPGNVTFDHTDGLTLTGNTFQHLGAAGLQLGQGVSNSSVTGNVFTDISASGIQIGNGADATPADVTVLPTGNTVADNWIHNIAVEYTGGVGIFQGYTRNDTIAHNQVNNVPYSGISSNWGWGHTLTKTSGNKILNNLVYDYMQQRYDGGGIYVLGQEGDSLANGLLISGNVVSNAAGGGHAIYTDGGSQYVTMSGNAVYDNHTPSIGGCKEGPPTPYGDFSFTGNYFENLTADWPCGNPSNANIGGNTQVASAGGVPASVLANAGLETPYAGIAAPPVGVAPTNLAAHKPVVAQFLDGSPAQLQPGSLLASATDGDPATWVQGSGQFKWQLVVDLQQAQLLGYVTVGMPQPHFASDFHVDVSTDATSWTTVGTVNSSGWGSIPVAFTTPLTARYVRIVADKPDNWGQRGDQMAISEIGAYAPPQSSGNAALKRPAQALFIDGTPADMQPSSGPALANDGDPSTFAQATGRYRWSLQVDLQQPQSVDVVSILMPVGAYATAFHVDVSLDDSTFWTVGRRTDSAGGTTGVQLDKPVTARYVRVIADRPDDGGQPGGQMAISELAVYGAK